MTAQRMQSITGEILDYFFPEKYGFCLYSLTRKNCEYYMDLGKCTLGDSVSRCTGRRP
jgi:hypothetical protein